MQPSITIITPYRNADKFIDRFIHSLQAQTRTDWVCIMVDDGSTDNGPQRLQQLVFSDPRFRLFKNNLKKSWPGPASARNFALGQVDTSLIAFCDIDDLWHPEKLERQLSFHINHNLDLSVTAYARFNDDQIDKPSRVIVSPPQHLDFGRLRGRNPIPMLTVIMSVHLAHLGFMQVPHEDFLFWLEIFRSDPSLRYGCLPRVLAYYCIHRDNLSSRKVLMPMWTYRVFRRLGESRMRSLVYLFSWFSGHLFYQLSTALKPRPQCLPVSQLFRQPPLHYPYPD